jgi:sugar phosphate isomerase/epimerase
MNSQVIGVQSLIFSERYKLEDDLDVVLGIVASAGYDAIESGTSDAIVFRDALAKYGLRHAGLHAGLSAVQDTQKNIDYLKVTGADDICNSGLLRWGDVSLEDYLAAIPILNEAGRRYKDAGVKLHYHNHDFEFKKVDGDKTGMELLFDALDPEYIDFCIDVAWVHKGGLDPAEYLLQHNARIGYIHLKDYNADGWKELGNGVLDFSSIIPVLPQLRRVKWVVVEQDKTDRDPADSITISRNYLREAFGV